MASKDIAEILQRQETEVIQNKSELFTHCMSCGEATQLYKCHIHKKVFCKGCLMATVPYGKDGRMFKATCTGKLGCDCTYRPIG